MKYFCWALACFLHITMVGCIDYVDVEGGKMKMESISFPPIIDTKHLSPHPARLLNVLSVGKNCKGQMFKVPPIVDNNGEDRLYYLWFFDNRLVQPQAVIEPEFRQSGIITFNIDAQFILSHYESNIPADFYDRSHLLEFFVSDLPYKIPESRYIDDNLENEKMHGDYAYWIVSFSKDAC